MYICRNSIKRQKPFTAISVNDLRLWSEQKGVF